MDSGVDWGFVVFVGTLLFFAALHQWPPDGRRWQRQELTVKDQEAKRQGKTTKTLPLTRE